MKKLTILIMVVTLLLLFSVFAFVNASESFEEQSYSLSHVNASGDNPFHQGTVKFAELVKQKTDGKVTINLYPDAALGGDRELIEGLQMGSVDFAVCSTNPMTPFIEKAGLWGLPFLFESIEHRTKIGQGPIGKKFLQEDLPEIGLYGFGFFYNGYRHLFGNREVRSIEDLEGLIVRTQEDELQKDTWQAFGARPTPLAYTELYMGLQTGVVEAAEQPEWGIKVMNFNEVSDYVIRTGHMLDGAAALVSLKLWESFSPELQEIITESWEEACEWQQNAVYEYNEEAVTYIVDKGMEIIEVDKTPFFIAAEGVVDKWAEKMGVEDVVKEIREIGQQMD